MMLSTVFNSLGTTEQPVSQRQNMERNKTGNKMHNSGFGIYN